MDLLKIAAVAAVIAVGAIWVNNNVSCNDPLNKLLNSCTIKTSNSITVIGK